MIKVNGKDVDLGKALPLTIGDIKQLKKTGVDVTRIKPGETMDIDQVLALVEHVIRKADATITQEDIDSTPINELVQWSGEIQRIMPGEPADPSS